MIFKVAILQYPIYWADKAKNIALSVKRIMRLAGKADVALLPEMFTTGFCTNRPELAEPVDGPTMQTLQLIANQTGVALCGSFICSENGQLFNRGFFLRPNDAPTFVDKAHLYAHSGEDRFFTAGQDNSVFYYKGVGLRLALCYDLRFPVWLRNRAEQMYDILLVSANWPQIRIQYWDALVQARATENQCYIAAANPVGEDGMGLHYNGHSAAYDTHLHPLVHLKSNEAGIRIAEFDIDQLHHYRSVLPLWQDADRFTINK